MTEQEARRKHDRSRRLYQRRVDEAWAQFERSTKGQSKRRIEAIEAARARHEKTLVGIYE